MFKKKSKRTDVAFVGISTTQYQEYQELRALAVRVKLEELQKDGEKWLARANFNHNLAIINRCNQTCPLLKSECDPDCVNFVNEYPSVSLREPFVDEMEASKYRNIYHAGKVGCRHFRS